MKVKNRSIKKANMFFAYKMMAPMLIVFLIFGLFPILYSLYISLFHDRMNINVPMRFIGLGNYVQAFTDKLFLAGIWKTGLYVVIMLVGSIVIGMFFASLVSSDVIKHKDAFVVLSLIPWAVPRVVGGLLWLWIYDGNYGILNVLAKSLGLISHFQWWFNSSPASALALCAIVETWRNAPFAGLLLFAGFQSVPVQYYEAAGIDGANSLQQFWYISLPSITGVLMTVLILLTTWGLKAFDTIYVLTGGGPGNNTVTDYIYIYMQAFDYQNMGYASALGYLFTLIILFFLVFYMKLLKPKKENQA